jgi:hypothetical protein
VLHALLLFLFFPCKQARGRSWKILQLVVLLLLLVVVVQRACLSVLCCAVLCCAALRRTLRRIALEKEKENLRQLY